jgi:hypothetical protein
LDEFREGNVAPAFGQKEFYLQCKERMPRGKRIGYYRGDSASYQAGLFNQLEADGVIYGITVDQDKAVKRAIALIPGGDWEEPVKGCGYELAETVHCMNETERAFRLVVKRGIGSYLRKRGSIFIMLWHRIGRRRRKILKRFLCGTIRGGRRRTLIRR